MLQYLTHLIERTGQWGYLVIFLGAMLESAAFLGLVIPGESLVLLAGFLAAQGLLDLDVLMGVSRWVRSSETAWGMKWAGGWGARRWCITAAGSA